MVLTLFLVHLLQLAEVLAGSMLQVLVILLALVVLEVVAVHKMVLVEVEHQDKEMQAVMVAEALTIILEAVVAVQAQLEELLQIQMRKAGLAV
jgi:hypothetical protein